MSYKQTIISVNIERLIYYILKNIKIILDISK